MANFNIGDTVVNFGQTARVVGFWQAAAPTGFVDDMAGWPILRALDASGKPRGGKWAADPAKCSRMHTVEDMQRRQADAAATARYRAETGGGR